MLKFLPEVRTFGETTTESERFPLEREVVYDSLSLYSRFSLNFFPECQIAQEKK